MKTKFLILFSSFISLFQAQSYAPQAGISGSTAIHKDAAVFVDWASNITLTRGAKDIAHLTNGSVSYGTASNATGQANSNIVSLGDGGEAIITFNHAIINGQGADFAIFENGFLEQAGSETAFLEFAFVEVSTDGVEYIRFPSVSETPSNIQISSFGFINARNIYNLAGKYIINYGTPFDLDDLTNLILNTTVNLNEINYIKLIDVIGTINTSFASYDENNNIINDPYPTSFNSGGFDLNAIGIIHNSTTNSTEKNKLLQVTMYPNPSTTTINIQLKDVSNLEISIISLEGKIVLTSSKSTINISKLDRGIYFIKVKNTLGVYTARIVKN